MANKTIDQLTAKANPVDADLLVIADSQDNNEMKQITISSITADIGDGLIVDGSSSLTTTYSSTKIAADNATQDAALTAGLALKVAKAGDTMTGQLKLAKGADIASATTTDLGAATGNYVDVTGTATITGLGTVAAGTTVTVRFTGILILTYNATSLILPTGASITTVAGDVATFTSLGSGNWVCISYTRLDGTSLGAVNITGLTEDTSGDMDADFALVYDNSAGANRKQKVNVFRATDVEKDAGTSTTKFVTPEQSDKYGVNTLLRNDWMTFFMPIVATTGGTLVGWSTAGGTSPTQDADDYGYATATRIYASGSSASVIVRNRFIGSGSNQFYTYAQTKKIRLKWRASFDNTNSFGIGLAITAANIFAAETDVTNGTIRFLCKTGVLYACNANGTATNTNVDSGITNNQYNTYEIVYNPGVNILFYINGTLVATHTTNLPTTGTPYITLGNSSGNNGTMYISPLTLSVEF